MINLLIFQLCLFLKQIRVLKKCEKNIKPNFNARETKKFGPFIKIFLVMVRKHNLKYVFN